MKQLHILTSPAEVHAAFAHARASGQTIGFVPTMGALHAGHIALVARARDENDVCIASIFVNPKQFAPTEDLATYPRTEDVDCAMLAAAGCDYVFMPTPEMLYPAGFATLVHVGGPSAGLESDFRPHFFDGVATVVAKLLCTVLPTRAYFGEKDYQQLCVIQHLVRDLALPIEVIGCPTVREADGLAMSSRNRYLSPNERKTATQIYAHMRHVAEKLRSGEMPQTVLPHATTTLENHGFTVDYFALRATDTLAEISTDIPITTPARLLVAARLGTTRLIDNIAI